MYKMKIKIEEEIKGRKKCEENEVKSFNIYLKS